MIKYIISLALIIFFGCRRNENESSNVQTKKIRVDSLIDKIKISSNEEYYLTQNLIINKNNLNQLIYCNPKDFVFIIMDTNFNVISKYDLKKYDYYFDMSIKDFDYNNNYLYITDNFYKIKKYNLNEDLIEKLKDLYFFDENDKQRVNRNTYLGAFPNTLNVINDNLIVRSVSNILPKIDKTSEKLKENDKLLVMGTILDSKNNLIKELLFDKKLLKDNEIEKLKYSNSFINVVNDTIYVTTNFCNYLFKFDLEANYLGKYELPYDSREKKDIKLKETSGKFKGMDVKGIRASGVNYNSKEIEYFNNKFYRIKFNGMEKSPSLTIYNNTFNLLKEYEIENLEPDATYHCLVVNNNIYIFSSVNPGLYKLILPKEK